MEIKKGNLPFNVFQRLSQASDTRPTIEIFLLEQPWQVKFF